MIGFIYTIGAGFVWSVVNVVDKLVISKYLRDPIFVIVIFCLISLIAGVITVPFLTDSIGGWDLVWLSIGSLTYTLGNLAYFFALVKEEASRVVPLFSMSTVFIVIISGLFLGEIFNFQTYLGILVIIIGSIVLTSRKKIIESFQSPALWLMALASLGFAITYAINKYLLFSYSFWEVFGWQRLTIGFLTPIFILFFYHNIKSTLLEVKKRFIALSFFAETGNIFAAWLFLIATSLWYISLVETVVSVHYVFIFFWALIISRFRPSLFAEEINKQVVWQKVFSIFLIIIGVYLVTFFG